LQRLALFIAVFASGAAGLTWEVLWQHHTALALGVSAFGTAVTLSSVMAGIGLGGLLAARLARRGALRRPLLGYGIAELAIGVGGLAVPFGLSGLAIIDTGVYARSESLAGLIQLGGTALLMLLPATAMGATIPILAPLATRLGSSVAFIYALNILGAVAGVVATTFVGIPMLGVSRTAMATAAVNVAVAAWAFSQRKVGHAIAAEPASAWPPARALALVFMSGLVIFVLEVSWFRALRAALQATTESFAIILASFLMALALGGVLATRLRERAPRALGVLLPLAALAVLCATPAVERADLWLAAGREWGVTQYWVSPAAAAPRLLFVFAVVGIPATLLGTVFPWLLAEHGTTTGAGRLYAMNTIGSVAGALLAGFVLLPALGATVTSWLAAFAVLLAALVWSRSPAALGAVGFAAVLGLFVAYQWGGTSARARVMGPFAPETFDEIVFVAEGPDSTVWVARHRSSGVLNLVIDGFPASSEMHGNEYMRMMGHLPVLAARQARDGLVICFGVGQTAHAVRRHGLDNLWVVDVNAAVFEAAPLFEQNEGVLEDPSVHPVVMDGRAFLRRSRDIRFDLVTLEPMPPNFAGVNNLYSLEFYELIRSRLSEGGVAAQWVPFHLIAPDHMRAIVATFHAVFPYTRLWISRESGTGILVGGTSPWTLRASDVVLPIGTVEMKRRFVLGFEGVAKLAGQGTLITDDNQMLAYGLERLRRGGRRSADGTKRGLRRENLDIVEEHRSRRRPRRDR
jgi:predicted membrane-bound spermidine synthase